MLCQRTDRTELSRRYAQLHERLNDALDRNFWDEARGIYRRRPDEECPTTFSGDFSCEGHVLTQSLMLFCGAVPREKQHRLAARMTDGTLVSVSYSHTIFFYDALMQVDAKLYAPYIRRQIGQIWGDMVRCGSAAFWETEVGAKEACSLCHG